MNHKNSFSIFSDTYKPLIEKSLGGLFATQLDDPIFSMMQYALMTPAKRLRSLLTLNVVSSFNIPIDTDLIQIANAVELVHTYSLIHDDLPSMDNDDLRRGQPTVHKKYGEANAILTGDGLLTEAFYILATTNLPTEISNNLIRSLSVAAGPQNMVRGQQYDISAAAQIDDIDDLVFVDQMKTGALFVYSVAAGAILAGRNQTTINQLNIYSSNFGIAYQIVDDLNDVDQNSDTNKVTFPKLVGESAAKQEVVSRVENAIKAIENLEDFEPQNLIDLANSLVK